MKVDKRIEDLIEKFVKNEISQSEMQELDEWYENQGHDISDLAARETVLAESKGRIWNKLGNNISREEIKKQSYITRRRQYGSYFAAVAAMILVAVGLYISNYVFQGTAQPEVIVESIVRSTVRGEKSRVALADGTIIWLNADSKIEIASNYNEEFREIKLEGEAFFDVVPDSSKPFIVQTGQTRTTVLGTSFNIQAYNDETIQITVASGKVTVDLAGKSVDIESIILARNDQIIYDPINSNFEKRFVQASKFNAWKYGILLFDDITLGDVERTMERWYDIEINIENPRLLSRRLNGEYKNEKLVNILESIKFILDADYELVENQVLLK